MRLLRLVIVAVAFGLTASCASAPADISEQTVLTGCGHPSGWCDQIRETAEATWPYAQMSANAYSEGPLFELGPEYVEIERRQNDDLGFAYIIVRRSPAAGPQEWTIAFRGTEGPDFKDWWFGNVLGQQNARGLRVYDDLRAQLGPDAHIAVTGHSLGGGIATAVSLCRKVAGAFVFNTSPRFQRCEPVIDNLRISVVENGEFLKIGRIFGREATQTYTSIGCMRSRGPITQHGIAPLAGCLTRIAALESRDARESLSRNDALTLREGTASTRARSSQE